MLMYYHLNERHEVLRFVPSPSRSYSLKQICIPNPEQKRGIATSFFSLNITYFHILHSHEMRFLSHSILELQRWTIRSGRPQGVFGRTYPRGIRNGKSP